jgi:hypothetical protein
MTEKHIIFVDESGNAGANLSDAQPIFSIVGMTVRASRVDKIEADFKQLKVKYGFSESEEIKGGQLLKSNENRLIREALELILREGLPIFGTVIERRFMICALIVNHFIDPVYNNRVGNEWTHPIPEKGVLANYLYENLSEDTVRFAADPVISGDLPALMELHRHVLSEMSDVPRVGNIDAVYLIEGARDFLEELSNGLKQTHNVKDRVFHATKETIQSPNVTAFFDMLMRTHHVYEDYSDATIDLVFDSSTQFDRPFAEMLGVIKNAKPSKLLRENRIPIIFGSDRIMSFKARNSADDQLLQIVDFLASGIRYIHELCLMGYPQNRINEGVLFCVGLFLTMMEMDMTNSVASGKLQTLFGEMAKSYSRYLPNYQQ